MKKRVIFYFIFSLYFICFLSKLGYTQPLSPSKFYLGGNLNFTFGTVTYIEIAPEGLYRVNDKVNVGAGISYSYMQDNRYRPSLTSSNYGGKVFAQFSPLPSIFFHAEYQRIYYEDMYSYQINKMWLYTDALFLGIGYRSQIGSNGFSSIALLWNVLDDQYSFGINPLIRIGFGFGI